MNILEFANMLDGHQMYNEITREEEKLAKELGFVVVFGYSDDGVELRGAIHDEVGAWNGTTLLFDRTGLFKNECDCDDCPYFARLKEQCKKNIEAVWADEGIPWTFKTPIHHATFNVFEDDELFCKGIVFDIKELGNPA